MKNTPPIFSILIPAYKSEGIIGATIKSIQNQTFADFELIIVDDNSPDNTEGVIKEFQKKDKRIKYFRNEKNLGYSGNLKRCRELATGKYVYLMGNDDILSKYALEKTLNAFKMDKDVGVVTRPYYWFENNKINHAVRVVTPLDENEDCLISIFDGKKVFRKVFESVGQLSGLAYKRVWMTEPIHPDIFPAHIYPFLAIFREHKAVFLKDYILAVRIFSSQTRSLLSIYQPSPTLTWMNMFNTLLAGKRYEQPRKCGVDYLARNYPGLIQIRCYARFPIFVNEARMLVRYRLKNLVSLRFWFYTLFLTIMPRTLLIRFVDWYKKRINGKTLKSITLYDGEDLTFGELQRKWYDEVFQESQWTGETLRESTIFQTNRYLDSLGELNGKRILEIGCGDGLLTHFLLKRKFKKIVSVDISKIAIENAKENFSPSVRSGKLSLICTDIIDYLERENGSFDFIVGSGILHHIGRNQFAKLFQLAGQRLNNGGVFACAPEPNAEGFYRYLWRSAPFFYRLFSIKYNWEVEKGTLNINHSFLINITKRAKFSKIDIESFQLFPHFRVHKLFRFDRWLIDKIKTKYAMYVIVKATKK